MTSRAPRLAVAAHELHSPLAAIGVLAHVLSDQQVTMDVPERAKLAGRIADLAGRLQMLMRRLLTSVQIESGGSQRRSRASPGARGHHRPARARQCRAEVGARALQPRRCRRSRPGRAHHDAGQLHRQRAHLCRTANRDHRVGDATTGPRSRSRDNGPGVPDGLPSRCCSSASPGLQRLSAGSGHRPRLVDRAHAGASGGGRCLVRTRRKWRFSFSAAPAAAGRGHVSGAGGLAWVCRI